MERDMNFEIIKTDNARREDRSRFAIGKHTGSLYFVPDILDIVHLRAGANIRAVPIVAKDPVRLSADMFVALDELLPPGTIIKITT
jgi:hypothetical protein